MVCGVVSAIAAINASDRLNLRKASQKRYRLRDGIWNVWTLLHPGPKIDTLADITTLIKQCFRRRDLAATRNILQRQGETRMYL